MLFEREEIDRIQDAELVLLGIQPSELARMPLQMREDVLAIRDAKGRLEAWRWRRGAKK